MPRHYTPRVQIICGHCGTSFMRKASAVARRSGATYCGTECKRLAGRVATARRAEHALGEPLRQGIERRLAGGMTLADLAAELGLNDWRVVHRLMDDCGIVRRTRSEATRMQWVDNPERRASQGARLGEYVRADPDRAVNANLKLQSTRPTSIERALMGALDAAGIAYEFQYVVGDKFLCDFGFPDAMLIVETDGSYWHRTERQKKQDASKDAYLRACGFTVLRLTDVQVTQHLTTSLQAIQALLDQSPD
jgi:very-short-patch-repair endonuclease